MPQPADRRSHRNPQCKSTHRASTRMVSMSIHEIPSLIFSNPLPVPLPISPFDPTPCYGPEYMPVSALIPIEPSLSARPLLCVAPSLEATAQNKCWLRSRLGKGKEHFQFPPGPLGGAAVVNCQKSFPIVLVGRADLPPFLFHHTSQPFPRPCLFSAFIDAP